MAMRILSGQKINLYERGIVSVSSAHAQLGKDRLSDGRPSRAYRAGTLAAAQFVVVDGNLVTDGITNFGSLDNWSGGSPLGFTEANTGTGDVTQESIIVNTGGGSAAKMAIGTGTATFYRDILVKSGEIINVRAAMRGDAGGTDGVARMRVYNPLTHHYLTSGLAWGASVVDYRTRTPATYSDFTDVVTVEDFAACGQSDLVSLRCTFYATVGVGYVDDFHVWPRVNFGSIHGHNIDPGAGLILVSSTDGFIGVSTSEGAPTIVRPSFYVLPAATNQDRRWWGWQHVNAPSSAFEIGEAMIGYVRTPLQHFEPPIDSGSRWDYQASSTPSGERHVHKRSKFQIRNRAFHYHFESQAGYDDAYELFHLRPEGGTYPAVIVPDTTLPTVIHGRLRTDFPDSRVLTDLYVDAAVEIEESPFAPTAF